MFEKVRKLISEQLAVDEEKITPESRIKEDLGADSLDVLQMLMTLEEDYGIEIPDEELAEFKTVQEIFAELRADDDAKDLHEGWHLPEDHYGDQGGDDDPQLHKGGGHGHAVFFYVEPVEDEIQKIEGAGYAAQGHGPEKAGQRGIEGDPARKEAGDDRADQVVDDEHAHGAFSLFLRGPHGYGYERGRGNGQYQKQHGMRLLFVKVQGRTPDVRSSIT